MNNVTEGVTRKSSLVLYSALLLVLIISSFYLFYGGSAPDAARSSKALWNLGHVAYFAVLVLLLGKVKFIAALSVEMRWLVLLSTTLVVGILIEVLQYGGARTPDIHDVVRDLTGCFLVLAFKHPWTQRLGKYWTNLIRAIAALVLVVFVAPFSVALTDELIARAQFPVLASFETPFEMGRWDGRVSKEIVRLESGSDNRQMEVVFRTTRYSLVGIKHMPPNWQGYDSVNIRLYYPGDDLLEITVRIHDLEHETGPYQYQHHDRYHGKFRLGKGWNEIEIPFDDIISALRTRKMNLAQVRYIGLFTISLQEQKTVYIDKVWLK